MIDKIDLQAFTSASEPLKIGHFVHCRKCISELPKHVSPKEYANYGVGFTDDGIQIVCNRHEINVMRLVFPPCRIIYQLKSETSK